MQSNVRIWNFKYACIPFCVVFFFLSFLLSFLSLLHCNQKKKMLASTLTSRNNWWIPILNGGRKWPSLSSRLVNLKVQASNIGWPTRRQVQHSFWKEQVQHSYSFFFVVVNKWGVRGRIPAPVYNNACPCQLSYAHGDTQVQHSNSFFLIIKVVYF